MAEKQYIGRIREKRFADSPDAQPVVVRVRTIGIEKGKAPSTTAQPTDSTAVAGDKKT